MMYDLLTLNMKKTKIMTEELHSFKVDNEEFKIVPDFLLLGLSSAQRGTEIKKSEVV